MGATKISNMEKELLPHQLRVVEEREELFLKTSKLNEFIFDNPIYLDLPEEEKFDLNTQYELMCKYVDILDSRISRFKS